MCYTNKREFYNYLRVSYAMSVPDGTVTRSQTVTLLSPNELSRRDSKLNSDSEIIQGG